MFAAQEEIAAFVVDTGAVEEEDDDPLWGAFDQALKSKRARIEATNTEQNEFLKESRQCLKEKCINREEDPMSV